MDVVFWMGDWVGEGNWGILGADEGLGRFGDF